MVFTVHLLFFVSRYPFEHVSQLPSKPFCFTQRYQDVKKVLSETFFGPPDVGVYSPSVQNTLYLMAKEVLMRYVTLIWLSPVFSPLNIYTIFF
jgi:urate oxidase